MTHSSLDEDEVAYAGVAGQARLLAEGALTSRALVDLLLARIERWQPRLNAFRVVFAEQARAEADAADRARDDGDARPLLGVPIAVKDNVAVRGHAPALGTGSPEPVSAADDELVRRLRAAGMVVMGTTHLPELALWAATESRWHGITRNPWDAGRAPGGSSGGSAAAVAAGLVPAAHATDGLGSIRIPASSCGLVGLKPTHGLLPLGPDPDHWCGLSHAGFLTRTVTDTALLLATVTAGTPAAEPGRALRVAASSRVPPFRVDPVVQRAFEAALETLRGLGHTVTDSDPPYGPMLTNANTVRYARGVATDLAALADPRRTEGRTRTLARLGRAAPGRAVAWARAEGDRFRARMDTFFGAADVLVTPTVARLPIAAGTIQGRGFTATLRAMLPYALFTQPWNASGLPAVSVPAATSPDGVPIGVQLIGPGGSEARLLGLAAQLEEALQWPGRRPPAV